MGMPQGDWLDCLNVGKHYLVVAEIPGHSRKCLLGPNSLAAADSVSDIRVSFFGLLVWTHDQGLSRWPMAPAWNSSGTWPCGLNKALGQLL